MVTAAAALAGGVYWALLGSSLFDARAVQVTGVRDLPVAEVQAVAAVPLGTPMLRLDTDEIAARVATLPRVAEVGVSRTLGGTIRIEVTERTPVAVRPRADGVHLVDATGLDYAVVPVAPPGLPQLRLDRVSPDDVATRAALAVYTGLPDALRLQVVWVAAGSPADVVLGLRDEREVRWGGVENGPRKAEVLGPLLTRTGRVYDVSSPELPTVA